MRIVRHSEGPKQTIKIVREKTSPADVITSPNGGPAFPSQHKQMRWDAAIDISGEGQKKFNAIKDGDRVVDYSDVKISGYLSTFKNVTESDRDGDYVEAGAFLETIPKFMKNPVLLANHYNNCSSLAGSFTVLREDTRGLYFEAVLSNAQSDSMKDIRAKVAEGHLKTVSMGGRFHYKEDGRGIFKVDLFEGSLTPVPANPDAIFSTRQLTEAEAKMVQ